MSNYILCVYYQLTSKYTLESRSASENPLKFCTTHPVKVLNSTDDAVQPVGRGLLARPCAIGSALDDAVNAMA